MERKKPDADTAAAWALLRKLPEASHLALGVPRMLLRLPYGKDTDPIEAFLDEKSPWGGVTGSYVVTLGPSSGAEPGTDSSLPTLTATIGAFTRLWLGVRPASGLTVTDRLSGPTELLEQLDWVLQLPDPKPDWDF